MAAAPESVQRVDPAAMRLHIGGQVQGVGFRPFVYQLAQALQLNGWVRNSLGRVEIHVQGRQDALQTFMRRLFEQAPAQARAQLDNCVAALPQDMRGFRIRASVDHGQRSIHIPTDLGICSGCQAELEDPGDRRYHYPFINCTQCGPRYTLIRALPYDRVNTTMNSFALCGACAAEYRDPGDRRFHAEPVACPACGPELSFHRAGLPYLRGNSVALAASIEALHAGAIIAVKGIGGYHLMCDARSDRAVRLLRARKHRPDKPLAVLCPAPPMRPLHHVSRLVWLSRDEAALLLSPQRPIVLAQQKAGTELSAEIAPGLQEVGIMLPYSPLHHLLLNAFGTALVATSANISGEPVLTENIDVEERLGHVADAFLHHNRSIARPADDPVYRVIADRPRLLRPGRGCAPLELTLPFTLPHPVLAVGAQQKNTIALAWQDRMVISPHIGDMDSARSMAVFSQSVKDLQSLYQEQAMAIICDAHPGYATTRWAAHTGLPVTRVLHHHAHAAVATPNASAESPALVFTWDGTGYGADGTLWGGEALLGYPGHWQRFASLRPFHLPGGERAGHEPWRSAAALCWETGRYWPKLPHNAALLQHAWQNRINAPRTSAAGRLFDAAAALTGLCSVASFEGQGPMRLEAASATDCAALELPLSRDKDGLWISDWAPLLPMLMSESRPISMRGGMFHASLAQVVLRQAQQARRQHGITLVGLCGGVFQNRLLTAQVIARLTEDDFDIAFPEQVPVNDAGLCFGQVIEYGAALAPD
jgi:hydrogenase maturation protein HypF